MTLINPTIARIVVNGSPSGNSKDNTNKAHRMLLDAFNSTRWPSGTATFAITPGGFIRVPFPREYDGKCGWNSRSSDFAKIIPFAQDAINKVMTKEVLKIARRRVKFLTLGVDLNNYGGKFSEDKSELHAEIVGIVNTLSGKIVHWTGKSYPIFKQENRLVRQSDLESHFFSYGAECVLILGCHDLNMFGNRGRPTPNKNSRKKKIRNKTLRLVKSHKPTIVLHHPHSTDSPKIWLSAWGSTKKQIKNKFIYASSIAHYQFNNEKPREKLDDVLEGTRCCGSHVVDVRVKGI